jgi:hypothetical protein
MNLAARVPDTAVADIHELAELPTVVLDVTTVAVRVPADVTLAAMPYPPGATTCGAPLQSPEPELQRNDVGTLSS